MITQSEKNARVRWVRGASGTDYLCPEKELVRLSNPSEEQLREISVERSWNPQNE